MDSLRLVSEDRENSASEDSEYESSLELEVENTIREDLIEMLAKRICWLDSRHSLTDENLQAFVDESTEKGKDFSELSRRYNLTSKGYKQIFNDVQDNIDGEGGKAWGSWTWSLLDKIRRGTLKSDQKSLTNVGESANTQFITSFLNGSQIIDKNVTNELSQANFLTEQRNSTETAQPFQMPANQLNKLPLNCTTHQRSTLTEKEAPDSESCEPMMPGKLNVKNTTRPVLTERQQQFAMPKHNAQQLQLESELREKHMEVRQLGVLLNKQIDVAARLQRENDELRSCLSEAKRSANEANRIVTEERRRAEQAEQSLLAHRRDAEESQQRLVEQRAFKPLEEMLIRMEQSMKGWQRGPVNFGEDQNTDSSEKACQNQSADQLVNRLAKQSVKGSVKVEQEPGMRGEPILKKSSISNGSKSKHTYNWTTDASEVSDSEFSRQRPSRRSTVVFSSPPAIDRIKSKQDDIQAWFKRFEKVVKPQNWDNRTMAAQAATYFEEEAECVWEALDQCDQEDYMVMKAHMLKHFKMPGGETRFMTDYFTAQQQVGESPASFAARLRNLVEKLPSIKSSLSETKLARHFVGRLYPSTAQTLIINQFRNLEEAVRAAEKVQAITRRVQNEQMQFETVNAVSAPNQGMRRPRRDGQKCYGCGGNDHLVYDCPNIDRTKTCNHCGWKGHDIEDCNMHKNAQKRLLNSSTSVPETKGSDGKSPAQKQASFNPNQA